MFSFNSARLLTHESIKNLLQESMASCVSFGCAFFYTTITHESIKNLLQVSMASCVAFFFLKFRCVSASMTYPVRVDQGSIVTFVVFFRGFLWLCGFLCGFFFGVISFLVISFLVVFVCVSAGTMHHARVDKESMATCVAFEFDFFFA